MLNGRRYGKQQTGQALSPVHTNNTVEAMFDFVEATFDFVCQKRQQCRTSLS